MWDQEYKIAQLYKIDDHRKLIKEAKEIYGLKIKRLDLVTLPFVFEYRKKIKSPDSTDNYHFLLNFHKLQRVITNPKETVKFCIFTGGLFLLMGRKTGIRGGSNFFVRYDNKTNIFDIRQGMWAALDRKGRDGQVSFIVNGHLGDCKTIADILTTRQARKHLSPVLRSVEFETTGIVDPTDFQKQWKAILLKVRQDFWKRIGHLWMKKQSLKKTLFYQKTPKLFKVIAKSFNGHTYSLIIRGDYSIQKTNIHGYYWKSPEPCSFWEDFVHIKPNQHSNYRKNPNSFNGRVEQEFLGLFDLVEDNEDVTLIRDKVKAHITMTKSSNGARRYLYNSLSMKKEDLRKRFELEIRGTKWKVSKVGTRGRARALSGEARSLLENGLNGEIKDLEGTFPFHLNVEYIDNKWYVSIAGKKFHVKGGVSALKKVKTAISGNARLDFQPDGWMDGRESREVLKRFSELVKRKDALWIIRQVKIMGAMTKMMEGTK